MDLYVKMHFFSPPQKHRNHVLHHLVDPTVNAELSTVKLYALVYQSIEVFHRHAGQNASLMLNVHHIWHA